MKYPVVILFLTVTCFAFADNYPRNQFIDIKRYTFRLDLNDSTDVIAGEAKIQFVVLKPVSEFELDLINQDATKKGMLVAGILFDGLKIKYTHQNNRLKIFLPTEAKVNETLTIIIFYSGIPREGLIISKNKFGDRTFFGDNWPDRARNWLPAIDHPYEKAGVDFIVTAPSHYSVIANGIKLEESILNKKQKLTHWHEAADISTKVMVIGAARFAIQHVANVSGCIPVESWMFPQNRLEGFSDYAKAATVLEFFIKNIGPYSYQKLANVQSKTVQGGMENASNIFYNEAYVTGKADYTELIVHEISHQWFGNSATENDWHHVWLSEGISTFMVPVYFEFGGNKEKAQELLRTGRVEVIEFCKKHPAPIIDTSITDYMKLLNTNQYARPGWVLSMLRNELGDEAFWNGLRTYYKTFQNSVAGTSDFQQIMEKASGKKLDLFFQQWFYRVEIPALQAGWSYDQKAKSVTVIIDQTQAGAPFEFPLEIGLLNDGQPNPVIQTVRMKSKSQKITISAAKKPSKIVLDPGIKLLFEDISKN